MAQERFYALRREVDDLVAFQVEALTRPLALNPSQRHDCRARFERIMDLQEEVARLRKESVLGGAKRVLGE